MNNKIFLGLLVMGTMCAAASGRFEEYRYKRELLNVTGQWHSIILPDEIFVRVNEDFSDLRIFGITMDDDTVETPFVIKPILEQSTKKELPYTLFNQTHNAQGYYFTFELPMPQEANRIDLKFSENNFNWNITLEGSQDNHEWFTILERYRILSIQNEFTKYSFTTVSFPLAEYRYLRVFVRTHRNPNLLSASLVQEETVAGRYTTYVPSLVTTATEKSTHQTIIDIVLPRVVPVSLVTIAVSDSFDYYRPIAVRYITDSVKTDKGWKYVYSTAKRSIVTSFEPNEFKFENIRVNRLQLVIDNHDNKALNISSIGVKGNVYMITARFTEKGRYYLMYGNSNARQPNYDIQHFVDKIPASLKSITLGNEIPIMQESDEESSPLFRNMIWLWIVMGIVIVLLGWFSLKMITANNAK